MQTIIKNSPLIRCGDCEGSGDCSAHLEVYITEDTTAPCEYCKGLRVCPTCNGRGELPEDYVNYLQSGIYGPDPRD